MPSKEIKELRQSGKLDEAYVMALAEMQHEPENIWCKRNMSWVLYSQLDSLSNNIDPFLQKIEEVKELKLPETEVMFYDNISIVIAKSARAINSITPIDLKKLHKLFDSIREIPFKRDSKWFSVLYSSFHKGMKESPRYLEFADWWDFTNFKEEDFQKEKLPNGKEVMSHAEQAYIAYSKHLLPSLNPNGERIFDKQKVEAFLPKLDHILEKYPNLQYPAYFKAKLLLAIGSKNDILSSLLPFAKKKRNDFWVWEILGEAFHNDPEKVLACYCRALICKSPEEMLVGLRQKLAAILINRKQYCEAKTEIVLLTKARIDKDFKIPNEIAHWQNQEWYKNTQMKPSNIDLYNQYSEIAEGLLYSDIPEESIIVEFVNSDKKILNFIASESKHGFLKYERFFKEISIGEVLKARFQSGTNEGLYQVYTLTKTRDDSFRKQFLKEIEGDIRIPEGKTFGFVNDVYVHPSFILKNKLADKTHIKGIAMKSYNAEKKQWGWKIIESIE